MSGNKLVKGFLDVYKEMIEESKNLPKNEQEIYNLALICLKNAVEELKNYDDLDDWDKNIFKRIMDKNLIMETGD